MNTARPESVPHQFLMLAACVYTLLTVAAEVVWRPVCKERGELEALKDQVHQRRAILEKTVGPSM